MICIPFSAETNDQMLALIARAEKETADLYEYRFDAMSEKPEVERLMAAASRPIIATCRSVSEGGGFRGGFAERRSILRRAGLAGAAYIDSEASDLASLEDCGDVTRINSLHDFDGTPAELDYSVSALASTQAEWVKIAVTARRHGDNLKVFAALAKCPKPAIATVMGPLGVVSRILGGRYGSRVTYGSLDSGFESAPGQTTARDLAHLYRVHSITGATVIHGFLGNLDKPVPGHIVHNRAFANAGLDAVCVPFLAGDDAGEFLSSLPDALGLRSLAVDGRHAELLVKKDDHWLADDTDSPIASESAVLRHIGE